MTIVVGVENNFGGGGAYKDIRIERGSKHLASHPTVTNEMWFKIHANETFNALLVL